MIAEVVGCLLFFLVLVVWLLIWLAGTFGMFYALSWVLWRAANEYKEMHGDVAFMTVAVCGLFLFLLLLSIGYTIFNRIIG